MAEAKLNFVKKTIPVKMAEYQLTLTPAEVVTLLAITEWIGGAPDTTLRGYSDSIRKALLAVVADYWGDLRLSSKKYMLTGQGITFLENSIHNPEFKGLVENLSEVQVA